MGYLLDVGLGLAVSLAAIWLALLLVLLLAPPQGLVARDAVRALPDVVRLLRRLAAEGALDRGSRIRVALLLAYMAWPFNLIPNFIPVVGQIDDAILATVVIRSVYRRAGADVLRRHWPGSPAGLEAMMRLLGLPSAGPASIAETPEQVT